MQEVMKSRRQQHSNHRQEEHPAEQGVPNRKDLRRWSRHWVHRTHARENHRRIQRRIQPRQSVERVVADRAQCQRCEDKRTDDSRVTDKPTNECAAEGASVRVRHVDEYRTPCESRKKKARYAARRTPIGSTRCRMYATNVAMASSSSVIAAELISPRIRW